MLLLWLRRGLVLPVNVVYELAGVGSEEFSWVNAGFDDKHELHGGESAAWDLRQLEDVVVTGRAE